ARHQLGDVGGEVVRQRELAEPPQHVEHLVGGHPRGGGVPQRQRRQPVGVDVLGALLQLGERGEGVAGLGVPRVVHLHQNGAIPLNNQRVGGVVIHSQQCP